MRVLSLVLMLITTLPALAERQRVVVGVNHAPPYRIVDGDQFGGLYIDIFNEIGRRMDWEIVYKEVPFRRILWLMENGKIDVMLGPLRTEKRATYMDFVVKAFPPERRLFFYHKDENRISRYDDLYGKKIGVLRGSTYFPRLDEDAKLDKISGNSYENLMRMLGQDHLDIVVVPELVGLYTAEHFDIDARVSPYTVPGKMSWIAVAHKSPLMLERDAIKTTMEQLSTSPRYHNLIQKYRSGVIDEPPLLQVSN